MKVININGQFKKYSDIPKVWNNVQNYNKSDSSVLYEEGWRNLIYPSYNSTTQKLGEPKWVDVVGGEITLEVIDLPEAEVKANLLQNEKFEKQKLIQEKLNKQIEDQIQALTDNGEILANKKGYPIWEEFADGTEFGIGFILKDFVGLELVVFKGNTLHTKSATDKPELSTKWDSITMAEWVPGQTYNIGEQVTFNGKIYESQINNNTNSPGSSSKDIWLEVKV